MQEIFQEIQTLWDELNTLRPLTPDQEQRIWQKFRLDWNYHSNHLEGNSLTYGETKSLLLHNITAQGKPLKDHLEITGHNEAIDEIRDAVKQQRPITESFLRSLHTLILKERYQVDAQMPDGIPTKKWVEVGQYKSQSNHVVTVTGEVFRFAEPFEVPVKMQALVAEANEKKSDLIEGLLHAAKLHYEFVLIHPFDDGNGRMARILMNLILMQYGLPPAVIKTEAKEEYFSALRQADGGQFEKFAEYIAARVHASLAIMVAGARGESIDDPDDLDKKILLLKSSITELQGGTLPPVKSKEVLRNWLKESYTPLLKSFIDQCMKFSDFYVSTKLSGGLDNRLLNDVMHDNEIVLRVSLSEDSQGIWYSASYSELKIPGLERNNTTYSSSLNIEFGAVSYKVDMNGANTHHFRYDEKIPPSYTKQILDSVAEQHIASIEACRKNSQNRL
jgi:Fic family protein